jgi:hypothetical protein
MAQGGAGLGLVTRGSHPSQPPRPPSTRPQIINQFGELEQDLAEKQRYALWRAAEINKALRAGRAPPLPPDAGAAPAGGDADDLFAGVPAAEPGASFSAAAAAAPPPPAAPFSGEGVGPSGSSGGAPPPAFVSTTSTDSDVRDLPTAPSGAPPVPAAARGPRFGRGARVLRGGVAGGAPEPGTVGMVLRTEGPDPIYKVRQGKRGAAARGTPRIATLCTLEFVNPAPTDRLVTCLPACLPGQTDAHMPLSRSPSGTGWRRSPTASSRPSWRQARG